MNLGTSASSFLPPNLCRSLGPYQSWWVTRSFSHFLQEHSEAGANKVQNAFQNATNLEGHKTEQLPTIHWKPFLISAEAQGCFTALLTGFLLFYPGWVSAVVCYPRSYLLSDPAVFDPLLSPSWWGENKAFVSLNIHAFEVSPSVLSSLSRYFPRQRQFPPVRGMLKWAAKKIHYSLGDTNKYEVSTCIF